MSLPLYLFGYFFTFVIGMAFSRPYHNPEWLVRTAKVATVVGIIGMFTTMISTTYVITNIPGEDIETLSSDDYTIDTLNDQSSVIMTESGHKIPVGKNVSIQSNQTIYYTAQPAVVNYWFGIAQLSTDKFTYTLDNK